MRYQREKMAFQCLLTRGTALLLFDRDVRRASDSHWGSTISLGAHAIVMVYVPVDRNRVCVCN